MRKDQIFQHCLWKRMVDILGVFFKAVVVGDTFWNYCFCFVLLCQNESVEVFIRVEILVENISRFNMYGKAVCHCFLSFIRHKKSNKFSIIIVQRQKVTCIDRALIGTTIEKVKLVRYSGGSQKSGGGTQKNPAKHGIKLTMFLNFNIT